MGGGDRPRGAQPHHQLETSPRPRDSTTATRLTAFDSGLRIVPALAERWDLPNVTTYVFHRRRDVKLHDGTEFSAEEVEYTFDIVLNPKGPAVPRFLPC